MILTAISAALMITGITAIIRIAFLIPEILFLTSAISVALLSCRPVIVNILRTVRIDVSPFRPLCRLGRLSLRTDNRLLRLCLHRNVLCGPLCCRFLRCRTHRAFPCRAHTLR